MRQHGRCGFSLLEVMLATTVLLGSVIVLSQIAFVGTAHMDRAEQYAAAELVCQARMNEMLAGAVPIEEVRGRPIPELPGWGLTVKVESAGQPGLLALEVTAAEAPSGAVTQGPAGTSGGTAVAGSQAAGTGKQFTLVRWIAEPEGSETTNLPAGETSTPVDVPMEPSLFDDSLLTGDLPLSAGSMPADETFMPEEPVLPEEPLLSEEPSMFDEPMPQF